MLTAKTLELLAAAADHRAYGMAELDTPELHRKAQALRIAAEDARRLAQSANGFGTPETLALVIVIDNDRDIAERRAALVADHLARYASGRTEDGLREGASYLADALGELVEELAGFEDGIPVYAGKLRAETTEALPDVTAALARAAFHNVDWIGLALYYLTEATR